MSRINTNVSSLVAQTNLAQSNKSLTQSLERLSTGLRINRGSDDPSGLIVSERLRSEIAGVTADKHLWGSSNRGVGDAFRATFSHSSPLYPTGLPHRNPLPHFPPGSVARGPLRSRLRDTVR